MLGLTRLRLHFGVRCWALGVRLDSPSGFPALFSSRADQAPPAHAVRAEQIEASQNNGHKPQNLTPYQTGRGFLSERKNQNDPVAAMSQAST